MLVRLTVFVLVSQYLTHSFDYAVRLTLRYTLSYLYL